jgi:hypothetical protein
MRDLAAEEVAGHVRHDLANRSLPLPLGDDEPSQVAVARPGKPHPLGRAPDASAGLRHRLVPIVERPHGVEDALRVAWRERNHDVIVAVPVPRD